MTVAHQDPASAASLAASLPWGSLAALDLGADAQLVAELGRGAETSVYRVRRGGVDYALKVLRRMGSDDDAVVTGFRREAALLARIDDPGVPKVFDAGVVGGHPYLVMEFIDGQPLSSRLTAGRLDPDELLRLAGEVAATLAAVHRSGLVHRDVKPANIIMTESGQARLIDFGLANGTVGSSGGAVVGTLDYSAPEQAGMLARPVDGRADLYALGVVLFECATGELPFQAQDVAQLLTMHASTPAPDARDLRPDLPAAFAELIGRLLAKDPDDRVQSARDLLVVVDRLRGSDTRTGAADAPGIGGHLIGRDQEQAALRQRWSRARAGNGGVVLVHGPAGAGSRSLASCLVEAAAADGALVLSGRCNPDSAVPLAPLRAAVDTYVRTVTELPARQRAAAVDALREAVGEGASLLGPLSPALGSLLDAPPLATDERHDQFTSAVAGFLIGLGRRHGGVLIMLEDVQWLDPASRAVLERLAEELASVPALVLATARDEEPGVVESFAAVVGGRLDLRLPLGPLDSDSISRLVSTELAGAAVSPEVVAELAGRVHGNPLLVQEYLQALIEAGALRPCWGHWRLDSDRLQAIELPGTILELVLARVAQLGEHAREVLTVAAALGGRFDAGLLAEAAGSDPMPALGEAVRRGVLHERADGYGFVHDRARETLLTELDQSDRRRLHQRIAEVLDARGAARPADTYAVAQHYANGETTRTPDRVLATAWTAAQLALDENAPAAAIAFLQPAMSVAEDAGIAVDSRVCEALARAYLATGHAEAACDQLEPALARETDPVRRAALRLQLATVARMRWELTLSIEHVRAGLAELGRPVPGHPARQTLASLEATLRWLLIGSRRPATSTVTGVRAERLRLEERLCRIGAASAALGLQTTLLPIFTLRPAKRVHRLGPTAEYAMAQSSTGILASMMRLRRRRDRIFDRVMAVAEQLRDPQLTAAVTWLQGYAGLVAGEISGAELARITDARRRMLEADFASNIALNRARELLVQGYVREALDWHDRGRVWMSDATAAVLTGYPLVEAAGRSLLGQACEVPAPRASVAQHGADIGYWMQYLSAVIQIAVEQDELGDPFTSAVSTLHGLKIPIRALPLEHRTAFVFEALGWLTKAQQAATGNRAELLGAARAAVRRLGKAANDPLLRAFHQVTQASLDQLCGRSEQALARLGRADELAKVDAPLARYEAARVRARALRALGAAEPAAEQAEFALMLAAKYGWSRRARWIRTEFGMSGTASNPHHRAVNHNLRHTSSAGTDRYRRRLEALQQVNAAAATVLDPRRLAAIALDETLRILGAERAVLFLTDPDGALTFTLGRTGAGDLGELTGYSASLVERVATDRRPLVVTGGDEGAALGSQSAVMHGLRSIMIAPLELDGRLLGVVYLDSRVAKGVFTDDDVDILTAVCAQVAVSLETARAAQLEVAVHVARQQRDTAETLRDAVNQLASSLDPEQVLQTLCDIVGRAVNADRVCLVRQDSAGLAVISAPSGGGDGAPSAAVFDLTGSRAGDAGDVPAAVAGLLGEVDGWLAIPVQTRGAGQVVLLAGSTSGHLFGPAEVDTATALVGQGATAYDNALLFAQVQNHATTDPLTGLFNRRHFAELADSQLSIAQRNHRPMIGLMIDIDHFKRINDTYGHAAGDDVIRAVADVLKVGVRHPDVLCRYGGEEFAIVMSEMHGDPAEVAERLRAAVADRAVPTPQGPISVTVSIGVASLESDDELARLLNRADEALYLAKNAGRNQVRTARRAEGDAPVASTDSAQSPIDPGQAPVGPGQPSGNVSI